MLLPIFESGARGGSRTRTTLRSRDFKSVFLSPAHCCRVANAFVCSNGAPAETWRVLNSWTLLKTLAIGSDGRGVQTLHPLLPLYSAKGDLLRWRCHREGGNDEFLADTAA